MEKIISGGLNDVDKTTVVVKFYSNGCHFCHALSEYFVGISDEDDFQDVYFFAYNVDDSEGSISQKLKLNGVPSIGLFQTQNGKCTKNTTIKSFIKREKQ